MLIGYSKKVLTVNQISFSFGLFSLNLPFVWQYSLPHIIFLKI